MAEIFNFIPPAREPNFSSDPTDVSVVRFFEGTPFEESERRNLSAAHTESSDSTATVIVGRTFGNRTAYRPAHEEIIYDERRAQLDAQYLEVSREVLGIAMKHLRIAAHELSVLIAAIRDKPPAERGLPAMRLDMHNLFADLFKANGEYQSQAPHYAKLVIEIEDRIEQAQRYMVEHAP